VAASFEARRYLDTRKNGPLHDVSKHTLRPACGLCTRCATSAPATENRHGQPASVAKVGPLYRERPGIKPLN
jgi:hypothetical protein